MTELLRKQIVNDLFTKKNVILVGEGIKTINNIPTDRKSIVVGVICKEPVSDLYSTEVIPPEVDNIETDVRKVGRVKLLRPDIVKSLSVDRKTTYRPVPGGVSMGEKTVSAGTGNPVYKKGKLLFISNNHVYANCNKASIGSEILQPGYIDGGRVETHTVATLSEFVEILYNNGSSCIFAKNVVRLCNLISRILHSNTIIPFPVLRVENTVDCALAEPTSKEYIINCILEDDSNYIEVMGEIEHYLGMGVKKNGRTTGTTHSTVSISNATVDVVMDKSNVARFTDQFCVDNPFAEGGDSGSYVLDNNDMLTGLLFAGSDDITIVNRWNNVRKALKLDAFQYYE